MNLLETKEVASLTRFGGEAVAKLLMKLLKIDKLNKVYAEYSNKSPIEFIDDAISYTGINLDLNEDELNRVPKTGAFITVSNHPLGGVDGLLILQVMLKVRPDFRSMGNFLLQRFKPLKEYIIPVNPFDSHKEAQSSLGGLRACIMHVREGHPLSVFPAGEVSTYQADKKYITDRKWQEAALRFIKHMRVPVVPVYFQGNNSQFFYLLGRIHPLLRTARLPSELFNKKNKLVRVRIGSPISVKEQEEFEDISQYGRYLRNKTYALGSPFSVRKFFRRPKFFRKQSKIEEIVPPVEAEVLKNEIAALKKEYLLFDMKEFSVICAPTYEMPNLLQEIGRLREVTFRQVGEGTNMSIDLDEYDLYYHQLAIWDNKNGKVVGAYRLGKGKDILAQYGKKGFYIYSLFKISDDFIPVLNESLELGRSFIIKEYQRKPLPLFLLWKGILYFLIKNTEYRYLIGPVTISNKFSNFSQDLLVNFLRKNFHAPEYAKHIKPRTPYKAKKYKGIDKNIFLERAEKDINKLDSFIKDVEINLGAPVLLKKYIKLNARVLDFNIDPDFNDCLDGLVLLDIFDVPLSTVKSLSKEIEDESILERFHLGEEEVNDE